MVRGISRPSTARCTLPMYIPEFWIREKKSNYLPPPYTIFGKGEENSSRNEVKTFWLRLRKVEMAAWIRA